MKKPLVSIIIPCKNSSLFIDSCLNSAKNQAYLHIEIIADKYTKLIFNKGPERSAQKNYGAEKSNGKYLLFIDSDMVLTKDVVDECVRKINESTKAIVIPEVSIGEGFWAKCKALEKICYIGDEDIEAARFFDKDVFWKSGGWDEEMIASEDWDLHDRVKKITSISRINSLIKHNEGKISLFGTIRKKYYYGQKLKPYFEKNRVNSKRRYKLIRPAYIKNWRLFLKSPFYTLGLIIMKVCEFGAGGLGFIRK